MTKLKQPSANVGDMIEGNLVEKPIQPGKSSPSAKESGRIFLTSLAALVLSGIALGFASFAVWQNSQTTIVATPPTSGVALSEATKQRFTAVNAKIVANGKSQRQAIAALNQRLDQQATDFSLDNAEMVGAEIDQRFAALEMMVQDLSTAIQIQTANETDEVANNEAGSAFSITPDQVSLLIISGLLADNMAGASLDRWTALLQGLTDQGVSIPNLAQLLMVANPTPERPLYLIRTAFDLVPQMTAALSQATDDAGFLKRTAAKLGELVQLREIGVGADGNEAVLSAFETALAMQDLDEAVRAAGRWSGPNLPSLKKWMAAAQSRQSLDRAVSVLVTDRLASAIALQL